MGLTEFRVFTQPATKADVSVRAVIFGLQADTKVGGGFFVVDASIKHPLSAQRS